MDHFNMITGEPESPPNNNGFGLTEQEVVTNANLLGTLQGGGYYYDTNTRMLQAQSSGFSNYMNPPGSVGNPAFAAIEAMQNGSFQSPYCQPPQVQDQVYTIPGFNPSGDDMVLPEGIEDIKRKLQLEMLTELDVAYEKKLQKQREFYQRTGYSTNYYGMPYISYDDPAVYNKYRQMVEEIRQQAIDNRQSLNKRLSTFAHNYIYGECDEEEIAKIYDGQTIVVPAAKVESDRHQMFLESLQEVEPNVEGYRKAFKKVTDEHNRYFGKKEMNLDSFLEGATYMMLDDMLNEEQQRRRDMSSLYQQNGGYRSLIQTSLMERRRRESGDMMESAQSQPANPFQLPTFKDFPTLMQSGTILEDGSISISPPDSIYTPSMNPQTIMNENETKYQQSRERFKAAIFGNDPAPGGVT